MFQKIIIIALALAGVARGENMSGPKTLLEMSGVHQTFQWKNSALILVDYQNEYRTGSLPLYEVESSIQETAKLLQMARDAKIPIIHVVHQGAKGGLFDLSAKNGAIVAELVPQQGENVVVKTLPNSFAHTSLEKVIREHGGVTNLIVAGLMTHMCLDSTVRSAVDHGFTTVIVASTTTTRDLRNPSGATVKAQDVKNAELAALQDRFALIVTKPEELATR